MSDADRHSGPVYPFGGHVPQLEADVFIAPTAAVIGNVCIGERSSVWFGAVIRGDDMPVKIGRGTNIQDGAVVHCTEEIAATNIGDDVVVGHGAILHGCTIHDGAMVGIGAIVLDKVVIGAGAIVAAGAIVPPGKHVPEGALWVQGTVRRDVNDAEREFLAYAPKHYRHRAAEYAKSGFSK
jgi:carbonic anhydrase/acetyltransferase-like protein (isoleucine patch superfamily)